MTYEEIQEKYKDHFLIKANEPIAKYTTLKIGGKADLLIISNTQTEEVLYNTLSTVSTYNAFVTTMQTASSPLAHLLYDLQTAHIPYYIIGGGSDVLFSDNEFHGVIIKLVSTKLAILNDMQEIEPVIPVGPGHISRHQKVIKNDAEASLDFSSLYFDEDHTHPVYMYVDAGVSIPFLIQHTLREGISGVHWFTHIPASIGGAIFNNIHGGKIMFADYVHSVVLVSPDGSVSIVPQKDMAFGYDSSRIQTSGEVVIGALLQLYKQTDEEIQKARYFSDTWIAQKFYVQPKNYSAGCAFKNLTDEQKRTAGVETNSTGYLIDKAGLRGYQIGDAKIYENHGNFFLNIGSASGSDFKKLIDYTTQTIKEKYGVTLEPEIRLVNF